MEDLLNDDINFKQNANEIVPGAYCLADKFKVVLFKITRSGTWKPPHEEDRQLSRMAKTPENVLHMLKDLQEKLTPLAKIELDTLVALKETDMENLGKPFIGFYRWDLHGFETDSDFEETPSQMMENWAWEPSVLREFASHYQTNLPIPEELLESIVGSRKQWPALTALHQIALATYDLRIHDTQTPIIDINQQFNELVDSITLIGRGDLSTHRVSMFTHMCGNYDSKYYTYIWSQIHAADMFASRFMKDGLDNPQTGRDYRNEILRPGSSRDPMINLKQFLGRMPNSKAFLKSVGLE
ncbi:Thimet oligopeptidase [Coemansia sp. RSA 2526]|nr:Thimet oligopeptidase [Coemansia sp. RSA 2526]